MARILKRYSLTAVFVVVLICAMLPLMLIYYTAHSGAMSILRNEVADSLERQNKDFSDRLQDEISRIVNTTYLLNRNWELGKLAVLSHDYTQWQKAQAYQNIQDKIYLVQLESRFIQNVNVYFPSLDKCLTTNSGADKLEEMRALSGMMDTIPKDQVFIMDGEMMIVSENTFSGESGVPNLIIQITLSRQEILSFFHSSRNAWGDGFITCLKEPNWPETIPADSRDAHFSEQVRGQLSDDLSAPQTGQLQITRQNAVYQVLYSYIPFIDVLLVRYFDINDLPANFGFSKAMLLLFAAVAALSFLLIYYAIYRLVKKPLKTLMTGFAKVEQGNLDFELESSGQGEFAFVFSGFTHMLSRLRVLVEQTYRQGQMVKRSEFKQLQAQIDPHFLYNGFFILNKRIRAEDKEGALKFSNLLSDYFRYVTKNARDAVTLTEEMTHAYNYAQIQQIRFSNRLTLELSPIPDPCRQLSVPRLVVQPIVENVILHVTENTEGMITLRISYRELDNGVSILIEDSGTGCTDEKLEAIRQKMHPSSETEEVSGLMNVHQRLRLFYGENYGLSFDRSSIGGLMVRMDIPNEKVVAI